MRLQAPFAILALMLGTHALTAATVLKGTVKNGTTGKPTAGDEVVLMSVAGRSTEIGRGKTDSRGRFEFPIAGTQTTHVVQVLHEGVVYQNLAAAGVNTVEVQVYDHAKTLDGVAATWGMQRLQTAGDMLHVIDEITIRNTSDPPRTLVNDRAFEIQLPPDAELVAGKVQIGNEQPILRKPRAGSGKDRYYFSNPLLPGETRFAVAYRLPYRGEAVIQPMTLSPMTGLVVVLPETMKFEAKSAGVFEPMPDKPGVHMYGTVAGKQGQPMAFHISGTGKLPESERGQRSTDDTARPGQRSPSSGLQALHSLRWVMLGGLALVVAASAAGLRSYKRKAAPVLSGLKTDG